MVILPNSVDRPNIFRSTDRSQGEGVSAAFAEMDEPFAVFVAGDGAKRRHCERSEAIQRARKRANKKGGSRGKLSPF
jgi:hypothetical protein